MLLKVIILRFGTNLIASNPPLVITGSGWTLPLVITAMARGVEPLPPLELLDREISVFLFLEAFV